MGSWNRGKGLWDMGQGTRDTSTVNRGVVVWDLERQKMGRLVGDLAEKPWHTFMRKYSCMYALSHEQIEYMHLNTNAWLIHQCNACIGKHLLTKGHETPWAHTLSWIIHSKYSSPHRHAYPYEYMHNHCWTVQKVCSPPACGLCLEFERKLTTAQCSPHTYFYFKY